MLTGTILTTPSGNRFHIDSPAKSPIAMVLNDRGRSVMDKLRLTGNYTIVTEFKQPVMMVEVEGSFDLFEIHEDFLHQD